MPLNPLAQTDDLQALILNIRSILSEVENQLDRKGTVDVRTDNKTPSNLVLGTVLVRLYNDVLSLGLKTSSGIRTLTIGDLQGLQSRGTRFMGVTTSAAVPTTTEYPNQNDWGFHLKTPSTLYLAFNYNGATIKSIII